MSEYIDKSALYEKIAQLEELARNRYLDTPSSSPFCSRYMAQLNERTTLKNIVADFPSAADVTPVVHGRWDDIPNEYISVASKDGSYHGHATTCSVCHEVNPNAYKTNYCPNCGAKMAREAVK